MDTPRRRLLQGLAAAGVWAATPPLRAQTTQSAVGPTSGRNTVVQGAEAKALFDAVFAHLPTAQRAVLNDPRREVQLALTRIDRDADGSPRLRTATWGVQRQRWFPAASVVKLPMALMFAEVLEAAGLGFNARSVLASAPRSGNWDENDPLVEPVWNTLWRVLVISENPPFNRLFDLLGPDAVHERLAALGFADTRLIARLGSPDPALNRQTVASRLQAPETDATGELAWVDRRVQPALRASERRFPFGEARKGEAWMDDTGRVVPGARDFSFANFLPVEDAHAMVRRLIFPERVRRSLRWNFSEATRLSLLRITGLFPRESPILASGTHAPLAFNDGYAKFLVVGDRDASPQGFRSFGKTGEAFGHQSETALLTDADGDCEVLLTANIYANADGVLNDDRYDYDTVSRPFLAALGRAALAAERERPRPHRAGAVFLPRMLGLG